MNFSTRASGKQLLADGLLRTFIISQYYLRLLNFGQRLFCLEFPHTPGLVQSVLHFNYYSQTRHTRTAMRPKLQNTHRSIDSAQYQYRTRMRKLTILLGKYTKLITKNLTFEWDLILFFNYPLQWDVDNLNEEM